MKQLILLLLFIPIISSAQNVYGSADLTIKSEAYISADIDISQAISYTNVNDVYNQAGTYYLGNGYYLISVVSVSLGNCYSQLTRIQSSLTERTV